MERRACSSDLSYLVAKLTRNVVFGQTSIMAVAYDKGVVLGADSRTTMGSYIVGAISLIQRKRV